MVPPVGAVGLLLALREAPVTGVSTRLERQARIMRERHEDVEDLLNFGASIAEIIERSGYKGGWAGLRTSLRNAGRDDLLDKLKVKLVDAELPKQRRTPRPKCSDNNLCANRPIDGLCWFHWRSRESRCTEDGCLHAKHSHGLCSTHMSRIRRAQLRGEAA